MGNFLVVVFAISMFLPVTASAQVGYVGRSFSGSATNFLNIGPGHVSQLLNGTTQITNAARVWIDPSGTGANQTVFASEISNTLSGISLGISSTGVIRANGRSVTGDTFQTKLGSTVVPTGSWHTIAAVHDIPNNTINIYLDGVLDTSGSAAVTFAGSSYVSTSTYALTDRIGNDISVTPTTAFKGMIADVAVYGRALNPSELLDMTQGTRPSAVSGGAPAVYFPLDEETDGPGRFANSRFGGLIGIPVTNIDINTGVQPNISSHPLKAAETRFPVRIMRFNADDASSVGHMNKVSSISLRHAGVSASQPSTTSQPLYKNIGGNGAITFASTTVTEFLTVPGRIDINRGVTVVTLADTRNTGRILSAAGSNTTDASPNSVFFSSTIGLAIGTGAVGANFSTYSDYVASSTGVALFSGRYSGNTITNWLNGTKRNGTVTGGGTKLSDGSLIVNGMATSSTIQTIHIGKRITTGSTQLNLDGDIYDMMIVNGALTDEEVKYLEGVMAWENNRTDLLPNGHPWKNVQPTANNAIAYPWGNSIIARSDQPYDTYLGSPSLLRTSSGKMYALHDYFGATTTSGRLYTSADAGVTWYGVAHLPTYQWGSIWQHTDGNLYILATTRSSGNLQVGKSTDEGITWTWTALSGPGAPLPSAGGGTAAPNYHRGGGLPPLYHNGYIFAEAANDPNNGLNTFAGKSTFVLYAPAESDLMVASNWATTTQLAIGSTGFSNNTLNSQGHIEGNIVVDNTGAMWSVLRLAGSATPNKAVFLPLTWNGATLTMPTWSTSFVKDLPGGNDKFQLIKKGNFYYALTNDNTAVAANIGSGTDFDQRNRVSLIKGSTENLSTPTFAVQQNVINQSSLSSGLSAAESISYEGFQYPSFDITNNVISAAYRVAWSGAESYHNSNFLGFGSFTSNSTIEETATPIVTAQAATQMSTSSVILNGTIVSNNSATSTIRGFEYGPTTSYGFFASSTGSFETGTFSETLTGLSAGTTYHYRAFAINSGGKGTSTDQTFVTDGVLVVAPPVISEAPKWSAGSSSGTSAVPASLLTGSDGSVTPPCCKPTVPAYIFTKTLSTGMTNAEVKILQQFLNAKGFIVSKVGAGSVGKETTFFGPATRAALARFQKANGISPAVGFFGPVTRAFIANMK